MTRPDPSQIHYTTGLGWAELDRVLVRGRDLTADLVGNVTFTDMVSFILRGRMPTADERRMLDALLVILIEHGMVSHVVAARLTYHNAPEAIQSAVAAALLGGGSKHLGSSEWCARLLQEAVPRGQAEADLDAIASQVVEQYAARKQYIPGIGHRTHNQGDPRAQRLFEIARETHQYGIYCDLIQRVAAAAEARHKRRFPVNVTGAQAAIVSDMGFRWEMAKSFALIGRTLGALGHIQEELDNPIAQPMSDAIYAHLSYEP